MVTLQIMVTEKCNLYCSYCYINNREVFMDRETFDDFYESFPFDEKINLDLFGGEPLLNWDLCKHIIEKTYQDDKINKVEVFSNGIFITQEIVDFLKKYSVKFNWSCDGVIDPSEPYTSKSKLLQQLCDSVSVICTPDNLKFIENYNFFIDNFNIIPNFKLVKGGWSDESVEMFKQKYSEFMTFMLSEFKSKRSPVPKNISYDLMVLYEGIKNPVPKQKCIDGDLRCMMSNGEIGFCSSRCTDYNYEIPSNFDHLYKECDDCEITNFCKKGCYELVRKNGIDKNMCELTKFTLGQSVKFNNELKRDWYWIDNYITPIFIDYEGH